MKIDKGLVNSWSEQPAGGCHDNVDNWASTFTRRSLGGSYNYSLIRTGSSANDTWIDGSDHDYKIVLDMPREVQNPDVAWRLLEACKQSLLLTAQEENGVRWVERTNKCVQIDGVIDGRSVDVLPALRLENGGLLFWTDDKELIVNHPTDHITASTQKDAEADGILKPTIRVVKLAKRAIDAPITSYQIERFLLAAPVDLYQEEDALSRIRGIARYIVTTDQQKVCKSVAGKEVTVLSPSSYKDNMKFWSELTR